MKKGLTEIVFILDRSGSMSGLEADTIGGFNSLIRKQRKEQGEAIVSTVLFDDKCEVLHDRVPMDKVQAIGAYLAAHGVTPLVTAHYRQACKQGWAPAPTNEYQKAIWDQVHEIPTEPLKIKYQKPDQATDAGK